jgi:hypothetical protein
MAHLQTTSTNILKPLHPTFLELPFNELRWQAERGVSLLLHGEVRLVSQSTGGSESNGL